MKKKILRLAGFLALIFILLAGCGRITPDTAQSIAEAVASEALSLIEEADGENVLVFYGYRHERDRMLDRYPQAVDIKSEDAISRWKDGRIRLLLAHPASAGHGLNLQSGGRICVWYTLPTSLELYQQACKRLHRQGQTKPVVNYVLLGRDTYDEVVYYQILQGKAKTQNAVLQALKARIESYEQGH